MAYAKPTEISVSGSVILEKGYENIGDVYIYRHDDKDGARARMGNHTNYGYSGYYLASIFDGKEWRKLQFNKLIPYENRSYSQAGECSGVVHNIKNIVLRWKGRVAIYDSETKSFRIRMLELPE